MDAQQTTGVRFETRSVTDAAPERPLEFWFCRAIAAAGDPIAGLELAKEVGIVAPLPAGGSTAALWELLGTIAAADVEVARIVEPHLDAQAILAEAHVAGFRPDLAAIGADESSTWGVFAAESGAMRLDAVADRGHWKLTGSKPWCSLASRLTHALVTAHTPGGRALFAVDLRSTGVTTHDELWRSRGMPGVPSAPVDFDGVDAVDVGGDGWYLARSGFNWGGLGVAAIWWGGAIGIGRAMFEAAGARPPDDFALAHLGAVDVAIEATRATLADAAVYIDATGAPGSAGNGEGDAGMDRMMSDAASRRLSARGRAVAAWCVETALERSAHSLGPGPLALDDNYARRHADLAMYVRQHHAERDDSALGRMIVEEGTVPW